ncbi:MAG: propanediol utilization protein, partial [Ruminococcaceae bacterium]|nr:propanediol utilization protein [Oscillospiraceae bacterium]
FGVSDKEIVGLKLTGTGRSAILGDVVIRVSDKFSPAAHLDTDEANAAALSGVVYGEIVKL